jgi:hypothetical protein
VTVRVAEPQPPDFLRRNKGGMMNPDCPICGEDNALELYEKFITNLDGTKSHLDCYLRLRKFPDEVIEQCCEPEEYGNKFKVVQAEPGGRVVVIFDLLPEEEESPKAL